jgi:Icc-related predicted phosphoesterase
MLLKIQLVSDIHLEYYGRSMTPMSRFLEPSAPILALCGDIGNPFEERYRQFLQDCSKNFEHVFLVAGNHEYYNKGAAGNNMADVVKQIEATIANLPNVHFLNRGTYEILPGVHIVGCTLWSHIFKMHHAAILKYANDFRRITFDKAVLTLDDYETMFAKDLEWLEGILKDPKYKQVIVMTHHMPTYELIDEKYSGRDVNNLFATELRRLMKPPVLGWLCGHSHTTREIVCNGVTVALNPYGGPFENIGERQYDYVLEFKVTPIERHPLAVAEAAAEAAVAAFAKALAAADFE